MVAKSYQSLEIVGDVFSSSGRHYVNVKLKSGKIKTVRWYSDSEYHKMYPDEPVAATPSRSVKEALGFTKGYITIFKGDTYSHLEWFQQSIARYTKWWGWYIVSTEEVPTDLPKDLETIVLPWELVGNDDGKLKSENDIQKEIERLIYDEGVSEFVGTIGDRLELTLTITQAIELKNSFNNSIMHIMEDDCGNVFVWTTASKHWSEGTVKTIRGTLKDHSVYKNVKQNILTRCMEVK